MKTEPGLHKMEIITLFSKRVLQVVLHIHHENYYLQNFKQIFTNLSILYILLAQPKLITNIKVKGMQENSATHIASFQDLNES